MVVVVVPGMAHSTPLARIRWANFVHIAVNRLMEKRKRLKNFDERRTITFTHILMETYHIWSRWWIRIGLWIGWLWIGRCRRCRITTRFLSQWVGSEEIRIEKVTCLNFCSRIAYIKITINYKFQLTHRYRHFRVHFGRLVDLDIKHKCKNSMNNFVFLLVTKDLDFFFHLLYE